MHTHDEGKSGPTVPFIQIDRESGMGMESHMRQHHGLSDADLDTKSRTGWTANDLHEEIRHHAQGSWKEIFNDRRGQNVTQN